MKLLAVLSLALALNGCFSSDADKANQYRAACDAGQQSACLDYQTLVARCDAPVFGVIPKLAQLQICSGVGP
jgi:hypothetical protein